MAGVGTIGILAIEHSRLREQINTERRKSAALEREMKELRRYAETTPEGRRILTAMAHVRIKAMAGRAP